MSTRSDFTIEQGTTLSKEFTYIGVDLTGASIRMQAREHVKSASTVLDLSTANGGIVVTDAINGKFKLTMTDLETSALSFKAAAYDIEVVHSNLTVSRAFHGVINLSLEITR